MIHIYRISKHLGGREISDQESLIQKLKAVENSSSNIVIHKETCFNVELLQGMYSDNECVDESACQIILCRSNFEFLGKGKAHVALY